MSERHVTAEYEVYRAVLACDLDEENCRSVFGADFDAGRLDAICRDWERQVRSWHPTSDPEVAFFELRQAATPTWRMEVVVTCPDGQVPTLGENFKPQAEPQLTRVQRWSDDRVTSVGLTRWSETEGSA